MGVKPFLWKHADYFRVLLDVTQGGIERVENVLGAVPRLTRNPRVQRDVPGGGLLFIGARDEPAGTVKIPELADHRTEGVGEVEHRGHLEEVVAALDGRS